VPLLTLLVWLLEFLLSALLFGLWTILWSVYASSLFEPVASYWLGMGEVTVWWRSSFFSTHLANIHKR
jgi:hypothetical protein